MRKLRHRRIDPNIDYTTKGKSQKFKFRTKDTSVFPWQFTFLLMTPDHSEDILPQKTEEWRNPVRHNARQVGRELECVTRPELGYVVMKGQGAPLTVFPTLWQTARVHPFTKHREQSSSNTEGVQASREPFLLPINESLSKCAASSLALSLPPPLSLSLW